MFVPGDVVLARDSREAVVLISRDGVLTVLSIDPQRGALRRSDVVLGHIEGVKAKNPLVRCDRSLRLYETRAEKVGAVSSVMLAKIAASYLKEKAVRAAEDRLHFARRQFSTIEP